MSAPATPLLLELEGVTRRDAHERVVLREVSLALRAGELVGVWGMRRSGRSTLLRIAAGVQAPDAGVVRYGGRELTAGAGEALGGEIGYCRFASHRGEGRNVLEELLVDQLARGVRPAHARARAWESLERTGALECAAYAPRELDAAETARVGIARALALGPALLVIDDPIGGVDLLERDAILALVRSLAAGGIAVLMCVGDATGLTGVDRAMALSGGELRGAPAPELAPVLELRRRRASA